MTLLSMVNKAQDKLSLPRSSTVISSTDQIVRSLLAEADEEGKQLANRHPWQALIKEKTFTSVAQANQTNALASDMGNPRRILVDSIYNRTQKRRVTGPLTAAEWQNQQALSLSLLVDSYYIRGGVWYASPTPPAGNTYAYEYVSSYWVDTNADGAGEAASWQADTDTGVLSEDLMLLGIVWRYRASIGLGYAEEFNTYEREVIQAIMRDGQRRILNFAENSTFFSRDPRVYVPEGSWNI